MIDLYLAKTNELIGSVTEADLPAQLLKRIIKETNDDCCR